LKILENFWRILTRQTRLMQAKTDVFGLAFDRSHPQWRQFIVLVLTILALASFLWLHFIGGLFLLIHFFWKVRAYLSLQTVEYFQDIQPLHGLNLPTSNPTGLFLQIVRLLENFNAKSANKADAIRFCNLFSSLLTKHAKKSHHPFHGNDDVKAPRNAFAHCNIYAAFWQNFKNENPYEQLREFLPSLPQRPTQHQVFIWNVHEQQLKFCYELTSEQFKDMLNDFSEKCLGIIRYKQTLQIPEFAENSDIVAFSLYTFVAVLLQMCF